MTPDPVEEIKNRLDLKEVVAEYIKVEKSGANFKALCPFHREKTPSLFISPSRQVWRCFGCGEGGDVFSFVQGIEGADFPEALRSLAQKAGVTLKRTNPHLKSERNKSLEICDLSAKYFQYQMQSKNGKFVEEYLKDRGLNGDSLEEFMVGYSPGNKKSLIEFLRNRGYGHEDMLKAGVAFRAQSTGEVLSRFNSRIMFPIFNIGGDVVAFGARKLTEDLAQKINKTVREDDAKYINTSKTHIYDKSNILYGLDKAKVEIRKNDFCVIAEGYTDVILAHQNGYKNVVAASGTSLTEQQLQLIKRFTNNIYTAFDMDIAGNTATRRSIDLAQQMGFNIKVVTLKEGDDPADVIQRDGKEWEKALKRAKSVVQFYIDSANNLYDISTAEGKRDTAKFLAPVIKNIPSQIERAHWVQVLADDLNVSQDIVWEDIRNTKIVQESRLSGANNDKQQQKKLAKRELIAEQLLLNVLKNPELSSYITREISGANASERQIGIIKTISKNPNKKINQLASHFTKEDRDYIDQLILQSEVIDQEQQDPSILLANYKKTVLSEELKNIERLIKENEKSGNTEENEKLLKKFSKKVTELQKLNN